MSQETRTAIAESLVDIVPRIWRLVAADIRRHSWFGAPAQVAVLVLLLNGPSDLTGLAAGMQISLPTASRLVAALADRGWVARHRDADDRRRMVVELTDAGKDALSDLYTTVRDYVRDSLVGLSSEECETLLNGMRIMARLASDCTAGDAPPEWGNGAE